MTPVAVVFCWLCCQKLPALRRMLSLLCVCNPADADDDASELLPYDRVACSMI